MVAMLSEITADDISVCNEEQDTRLVEIRIPDAITKHYESIFDRHEKEYDSIEVTRHYVYAEYHKDTNNFVYWLDLDNDIYGVTNDFSCDYLNGLILNAA